MSDADTTAWRQRAERCDDRVRELRAELARRDERDERIESMIRYGHASEGYGTRAVMDIFTVLRGKEFS